MRKKRHCFTEQQLADALERAADIREKSWMPRAERYKFDVYRAMEKACIECGLPKSMVGLLGMALEESWNDALAWADGDHDYVRGAR